MYILVTFEKQSDSQKWQVNLREDTAIFRGRMAALEIGGQGTVIHFAQFLN